MKPRPQTFDHGSISKHALEVVAKLHGQGHEAYLVGGCVRDLLLGKAPKDFDVATDARPEKVCALFRRSRIVGRRFRIVHVRFGRGELVEITTFRGHHDKRYKENHSASGMTLKDNIYGTFEEDAFRRDFSINALYYQPASGELLDPLGGKADLAARSIRTIGDPRERFREDPVRMLRALRFKAKLGFALTPETEAALGDMGHLVQDVPPARLFEEALKLFMAGFGERAFDCLLAHGLYGWLFPSSGRAMRGAASGAASVRDTASASDAASAPDTASASNTASVPNTASAKELVRLALASTDSRIAAGLPVTPAFIYAALLWRPYLDELALAGKGRNAGEVAAERALRAQQPITSIPRRFGYMIKDIWALQAQLPERRGKAPERLLEHRRFRAAYDFLLLREAAEGGSSALGAWWTEYQEAPPSRRQKMRRAP